MKGTGIRQKFLNQFAPWLRMAKGGKSFLMAPCIFE